MNTLTSDRYMKREFPFSIMTAFHTEHNSGEFHGHDFVELVYVVKGEGEHLFADERYEVCAGDVFIINPGEEHAYHVVPGKQLDIINCLFEPGLISDTLLKELGVSQSMDYFYVHPFLNPTERFHHMLNLRGPDAARALALLEGMMGELNQRHPGFTAFIRLQMIELLILLSRCYGMRHAVRTKPARSNKNELLVRRICGYLERHYDERISLTSLSELFNISTRQLNRTFKQEAGCSVLDHVHHIRVEKAKLLLQETDEKVITIATSVGYEDPAFFSQLFARTVGCSPGKYREMWLNA
ncbi:MAG: helix-turn-helix domain-containing protein [Paenibacillaceae bacterium]|nr:helix-turn-helix domain-containing protein [Paenibacillaceae bacterium]